MSAARLSLSAWACPPHHDQPKEPSSSTHQVILAGNMERSTSTWILTFRRTNPYRNQARKTKDLLTTLDRLTTRSCYFLKAHSHSPVVALTETNAISNYLKAGTSRSRPSTTARSRGCVYGTTHSSKAGSTWNKISHPASR